MTQDINWLARIKETSDYIKNRVNNKLPKTAIILGTGLGAVVDHINIEIEIQLLPSYFEPCGVEGRYVRVSLLTVLEGKISAEKLLDAFVRSANDPARPSVEQWGERWHEMISIIDRMNLGLPHYDEDKQFIEQVLAMGKYAISHSPEYREAYSPHYRIVKRDIFEQELLPLFGH